MAQFHSIVQSNGPPPTLSGSRISTQQHHIQQQPSMINTSFNGNQQVDSNMTTGLLKISNLPPDLTRREATLIFALVIEEMLSIEIKDYQIYAVFKNINTCITTGKLLDGKYIFGTDYPPIKVEYENSTLLGSPTNISSTQSAFNSLRLSGPPNTNISPPNLPHSQLQHQSSSNSIDNGNSSLTGSFDMLSKRQSIGNQRSRFVFSDPFAQDQLHQQQQQQQQQQQHHHHHQQDPHAKQEIIGIQPAGSGPPSVGPAPIGLSDMSGKSILLMESQNDAREYENLVRDSWGPTPGNSGVSAVSANSLTSGVDWNGNSSASNGSNIIQQQQQQQQPPPPPPQQQPQQIQPDRRRTSSSAFFNVAPALHTMTSNQNIPNTHLGPTAAGLRAILQQPENQPQLHDSQLQAHSQQQLQSQLQSKTQPQPPLQPQSQSQSQLHIQQSQAQQHQQQQQQQQSNTQSQIAPQTSNTSSITNEFHAPPNISQQSITSNQNTTSTSTSTPTQQAITSPLDKGSTSSKDVPDLSLLARVPPPANPADQNPPCNTLYVGNLPPDATESELRTLFSPQKGFRRLSFRTKNQSSSNNGTGGGSGGGGGHSHGPMCFVEFEDVAHATRALAELYGRALPRPNGGNGKGGIRLSFSKNPLGVRGPGNPRRTSTNPAPNGLSQSQQQQQQLQLQLQLQLQQQQGSSSGGNYGYSNYHQK